MKLKTKSFLTLGELNEKEFLSLIDISIKLKKELKKGKSKPLLKGKTLAMIFQKPSTRTRVSFETAMYQLGGNAINLSASDMQLSRGETIEDTAKTLSRYVDFIMARVYAHETLESLSKNASVPVINGLSDSFHPCQILADFMTIKEKKKNFKGLKIAWIGDGNNVCNSLLYGCALAKCKISIAVPKGFEPDSKVQSQARRKTTVEITADPAKAVKDADVVMTDTYTSIHTKDPKRIKKFLPKYQVNSALMKKAKKNAVFLHCLPAKRGSEVTSQVIDGPQSAVWDQAENRLHTEKSLLISL